MVPMNGCKCHAYISSMAGIDTAADNLDRITRAATNKPSKDEATSTLNQIIRAISTDQVSVAIDRVIDGHNNRKTIVLTGRVGAMNLTAKLELTRDETLQDYLR